MGISASFTHRAESINNEHPTEQVHRSRGTGVLSHTFCHFVFVCSLNLEDANGVRADTFSSVPYLFGDLCYCLLCRCLFKGTLKNITKGTTVHR